MDLISIDVRDHQDNIGRSFFGGCEFIAGIGDSIVAAFIGDCGIAKGLKRVLFAWQILIVCLNMQSGNMTALIRYRSDDKVTIIIQQPSFF